MRSIRLIFLIFVAAIFGLAQISGSFSAAGQEKNGESESPEKKPARKPASTGFPFISLKESFELSVSPGGRETADAAKSASADFDSDGVADLIIADQNGNLSFLKGNPQFLANPETDPFIETDLSATLGIVPDFLEQGDFNADGQKDILAARRGDRSLVLLAGLGTGRFAPSLKIELDGAITALATGEIGRVDGQTDVAVAVTGKDGAQLRIFERPDGAFKHRPEIIKLPAPAQFVATGFLGADGYSDIAVACGNRIVLVQGRGQVTPWDILRPKEIARPKAVVSMKTISGNIAGLAIGQFTKDGRLSLAVLTSDGNIQTLAPNDAEKSTNFADAALPSVARKPVAFVPTDVDAANFAGIQDISSSANTDQTPAIDRIDPNLSGAEHRAAREAIMKRDAAEFAKLTPDEQSAMIANAKQEASVNDEKSRQNFLKTVASVPVEFAAWEATSIIRDARLATTAAVGLTKARVGFSGKDDLVVIDAASNRVNVIAEATDSDGSTATRVFSFESETSPIAVLPVRLNLDAKSDLVVLRKGSARPTLLLSGATLNLTVNTNLDGPSSCEDANPCTLRGAIIRANGNPGTLIGFNISSNPTIALLDELPIVRGNGTLIAGLAINVPGVELDGTNAGFADGIKIRTSDAVVAGLAINSFKGIDNGNGSLVGGNGITIESTQLSPNNGNNWIFANYLGTDLNGSTDKGNNVGLNIFDAHDNRIGYSDPTYRQLISGNGDPENGEPGVGITTTNSLRALFHNNTIGLNITGAVAMRNPIGLLLTGSQNSIGGDGVGEGNTISGNSTPIGNGFAVCRGEGVLIDPLTTLDENGNPTGEILTFENRIKGSRIGTDVTGTIAVGNCREGILAPPETATVIGSITERGRNTVSGNGWGGINCLDISGLIPTLTTNFGFCQIVGNNVGTDITGTVGIPNLTDNGNAGFGIIVNNGINVFHNRNLGVVGFPLGFTFGDSCTGGCNLVNGTIFRSGKFGDVGIFSNYTGVNKSGTASLSNYPTSYARYSGVIAERGNTTVGDWAIAETQPVSFGNLLSGSFCGGLLLANSIRTSFATLSAKANLVGTDATGTFAVPNNIADEQACGESGVSLNASFNADIRFGGLRDEEKNIVAGNNSDGVAVGNNGGELKIINTFIGVNKFQQPLGNTGNGISFSGEAFSRTIIGGTGPNERNIIRSNEGAGIAAIAIGGLGDNAIPRGLELIGNSIADNGDLGFDLMRAVGSFPYPNDGVNQNDCYDADDGANSLQNYPTLIAPVFTAGNVTVQGALRSTPSGTYRIDFYSNSQTDPSNYGEGETYLGSETVSADGNGFVSFFFISDGPVPAGHSITATATNSDGETSEFSCAAGVCSAAANLEELIDSLGVVCSAPLVVTTTSDLPDANANDDLCDIDTQNADPNECSLRAAIQFAITRESSVVVVEFDIPGEGVKVIRPADPLPEVTKKLYLGGKSQPGYADKPLIEIRGDLINGIANGLTFTGAGGGSVVDALAINSFPGAGIEFNGDNGRVRNSYIGLYADGLTFDPARRQAIGISLRNSKTVTIGDEDEPNVISGNQEGIRISGGSFNRAVSNLVGVDKDNEKIFIGEDFQYGNFIGIRIIGSNSNIIGRRLVRNYVSSNRDKGIEIAGNSNAVEGVNLGIDETSLPLPNGQFGIDVISGVTNVIGGTREGDGNVFAAHDVTADSTGILIRNTAGTGTLIVGNQIGLNRSGNSALPNNFGIRNYARGTLIGNVAGVNIIVSKIAGILLSGENSSISGTELRYNLIGTNTTRQPFDLGEATPTGIDLRGNGTGVTIVNNLVAYNRYGIYLKGNEFTIGENTGMREFPAISKNEIFGQRDSGIWVDSTSSGNTIANNLIGTVDNLVERYRNKFGIRLQGSNNNVVQNIISGNTDVGIFIEKGEADPVEQNNRIENNRIGTDEAGIGGAPNNIGVFLANGARANEVFENLISGNDAGIRLSLTEPGLQAVSGNFIYSNKIGTNKDAAAAIGNRIGIVIADGAAGNTIGRSPGIQVGSGGGNVISGNSEIGVKIAKLSNLDIPAPTQNVLVRNRIGVGPRPNASATSQQIVLIPNGIGIHVGNGANNNTIGGALGIFTSSNHEGNIVSANLNVGIVVCPVVSGVSCVSVPGSPIPFGNKITGNLAGLSDWEILGRILLAPNREGGILVQDSSENFVGQQDSGGEQYGNVVVANNGDGIGIVGTIPVATQSTTRRNFVVGNFVGVTPITVRTLGNGGNGIYVFNTISTRIISNQLMNNVSTGILFRSAFSASFAGKSTAPEGNQDPPSAVVGNNIGVMRDDDGALVVGGNQQDGIRLEDISDVSIGLADANEPQNVIAANGGNGIVVKGAGSNNIAIKNNLIGTDTNGTPGIGNGSNGIFVTDGAGTILIGGPEENSENVITASVGAGVRIDETAGTGILVDPNVISGNGGLGIDINSFGPTPNDPGDADEGANRGQNFPDIVGATIDSNGDLIVNYRVDSNPANSNYGINGLYVRFFIADSSGEGRAFLGFNYYTVADHGASLAGMKTVNLGNAAALGFVTGDRVTSTASDFNGNTSEFTPVFAPTAANVSIAGRVADASGQPLANVILTLTVSDGTTVVKRSNTFGRYQFDGLESGAIYTVTATSRKYEFETPTRVINLTDDVVDADFIASRR